MSAPFDWTNPYPTLRTPVFARNVVATSQPLAAQAGLRMLAVGGNAIDAVIAAASVITLTEPVSNGLGSDAFAIVWDGTRLHGLNASGWSPAAWDLAYFAAPPRRRVSQARLGHRHGAGRGGRLGGAARPVRQAALRRVPGARDRVCRARVRGVDDRQAQVGRARRPAQGPAWFRRALPAARARARNRRALRAAVCGAARCGASPTPAGATSTRARPPHAWSPTRAITAGR